MADQFEAILPAQELPNQVYCTMCSLPANKICAICRGNFYCSMECARTDGTAHRLLCSDIHGLLGASQFTPRRTRKAIFFPDSDEMPRFVRVYPIVRPTSDGAGSQYTISINRLPESLDHLKEGEAATFSVDDIIQRNPVTQRQILPICVMRTMRVSQTGTKQIVGQRNKSLRNISHDFFRFCRGPILLTGITGHINRDLDLLDLRYFVDHMNHMFSRVWNLQEANLRVGQLWHGNRQITRLIQGVRINCTGDFTVMQRPYYYETHKLPDFVCAPTAERVPIGGLINLPLIMYRYRHRYASMSYRDRVTPDKIKMTWNSRAVCLNPLKWKTGGSVVLVREDHKPLEIAHAIALVEYCKAMMNDLPRTTQIRDGMKIDLPLTQEVDGSVNRAYRAKSRLLLEGARDHTFQAFWASWVADPHNGWPQYAIHIQSGVQDPYTM